MKVSEEVMQRARLTRDPRFDGRFYLGVMSTGIYCRPICPVQPGEAGKVRYFMSAAAAADAGFRPCLRCRPETAPGSPAWSGASASVVRALRLISEGALDQGSVPELASRLGIHERYLRKLFQQHLGASPMAVALTRRLHFAKQLLDETVLPVTVVAESAGFASLRRFNAAFRQAYERPPSAIRRRQANLDEGGEAPGGGSGAAVLLRLNCREPWSFQPFLDFFSVRRLPGIESLEEGGYRRSFRGLDGPGWWRVSARKGGIELEIRGAAPRELMGLVERIRRVFDLNTDTESIDSHLSADPLLGQLISRRPGIRLPCAFDPFEQGVRTIVGQQVAVKAAVTVVGRLVERFGERIPNADQDWPSRLFPLPAQLAEADLSGLGMTGKRAETVRTFARAVAEGRVPLDGRLTSAELEAALLELPGIGPWTAQYLLLRAFGEPDAFPASDLGLLKSRVWGNETPTARELLARAESWRPWRSYAAAYLWSEYSLA